MTPDLDVRSRRRGLGTSQEELSEAAGVSVKRIAAMEKDGVGRADPHDVAAVNDALTRIDAARDEVPLSHSREEREALGLSVAGLAAMAGVSKKTVARLEDETTLRPNAETQRAIRTALGKAAAERELRQPVDLRAERRSLARSCTRSRNGRTSIPTRSASRSVACAS
ncbi:helix-turn-helix domain-containing protein [Yinghuangia sp. ASG 101]|uniref:helix-turn-helix domain-containing protein n=1 Tax=Yinghuangia sp. ASG 101 TaxID=2896848 RepID=UPI001E568F25|nr:helix-turn-helix domain-containing protein [Yinghuangia sp. ASG 101]UGQ13500.1 helix-turn-helix domain-containing protein [Yinghuangia sp. ASG 101]